MNSGRLRVILLWFADAVCITVSWTLVVQFYKVFGGAEYHTTDYFRAWPTIFLFTGINFVARLYHGRGSYPGMPVSPVEELRRLVLSALSTHVIVMAFLGFGHQVESISRFVLIVAGSLTAFTVQFYRDAVRLLMAKLRIGFIPAYLVGGGAAKDMLLQMFSSDPYWGFRIVRCFSKEDIRDIIPEATTYDIKHLFCCYKDDRYFRAQMPEFIKQFSFIEYLPTSRAFPLSDARVLDIGGLGGLELVNQQRMKLLRVEKRLVDLALSVFIAILMLPVFIIVPVLIKLTSRGPVFYRAKRLGKMGRPIYIWKFRSMYVDADSRLEKLLAESPELAAEFRSNFKLKKDPRVTPFGKFLRRTSIDELPQLINVFRHDMALIGPRPIVEEEVQYYGKAYDLIRTAKPGITGLWQVSGRSCVDYSERVSLDVRYILNWSPWMDFWIVIRTVVAVLTMKGSC